MIILLLLTCGTMITFISWFSKGTIFSSLITGNCIFYPKIYATSICNPGIHTSIAVSADNNY